MAANAAKYVLIAPLEHRDAATAPGGRRLIASRRLLPFGQGSEQIARQWFESEFC
jgi:hypothetical protein